MKDDLLGIMVWYASVDNGFQYKQAAQWDATTSQEERPQEETLNVATEPAEMPAAPVRSGEVPEVLVTPAVTELPKRRTSPQQLDLEQAALDPGIVLPEPVPQDRVEVADQGRSSPAAAQADAPVGDFLQPL